VLKYAASMQARINVSSTGASEDVARKVTATCELCWSAAALIIVAAAAALSAEDALRRLNELTGDVDVDFAANASLVWLEERCDWLGVIRRCS
jgi:hypothetical protein